MAPQLSAEFHYIFIITVAKMFTSMETWKCISLKIILDERAIYEFKMAQIYIEQNGDLITLISFFSFDFS